MEYGLIGEHLPHSFSKIIHGLIAKYEGLPEGSYEYELKELAPDELAAFMKARDYRGINVTIPYKESVIPYLDDIDDAAAKIGAVNTIVNRNGRLYGYNTDCFGLRDLILHAGLELKGRKILILGTGGTSKTARYVCDIMGARSIYTVSRSPIQSKDASNTSAIQNNADRLRNAYISYDEAVDIHNDADIIINTTPVGMYPKAGVMPIDISAFGRLSGVIDVIYNPLRTRLSLDAADRGLRSECGLRMLVTQAVYAYRLFKHDSGMDEPGLNALTDRIYGRLYNDKRNIVLTGMPGSGKSAISRHLSAILNREYADTDELIVKREGRQISDIFASNGEEYFRDAESAVIEELSAGNGLIIATGGGAVLRKSNVDALKSNGTVIFIDRPLEDIIPTKDRPLSSDVDMLRKRYDERYDVYNASCDIRIANTDSINKIVENIVKICDNNRLDV